MILYFSAAYSQLLVDIFENAFSPSPWHFLIKLQWILCKGLNKGISQFTILGLTHSQQRARVGRSVMLG